MHRSCPIIVFVKGAALLLALVCSVLAKAQDPAVPAKPNRLFNDYAGVVAPQNAAALEQKLVAYNDSTSTQIAIVIERFLESGDAFGRSLAIAEAWGIGGAENDNGVLIYVAVDNRKVFIQTGYGVEDRLTDAMTGRIIEQVIAPSFRAGGYYQGLDRATSVMIELLQGRYKADPRQVGSEGGLSPVTVMILLFFVIMIIRFLASRGGGDDGDNDGGYSRDGRYRRRRGGGFVFLPGGGFGGGGFGGGGGGLGGGGGFGGFGGGGFGGGGAGGSW